MSEPQKSLAEQVQTTVSNVVKSARFDGININATATPDSRLSVTVTATGSVDLPGDTDQMVANVLDFVRNLGKPNPPSAT